MHVTNCVVFEQQQQTARVKRCVNKPLDTCTNILIIQFCETSATMIPMWKYFLFWISKKKFHEKNEILNFKKKFCTQTIFQSKSNPIIIHIEPKKNHLKHVFQIRTTTAKLYSRSNVFFTVVNFVLFFYTLTTQIIWI